MGLDISDLRLFGIDLRYTWRWWVGGLRQAMPAWLGSVFLKPATVVTARWDGEILLIQRRLPGRGATDVASLEKAALEVAADGTLRETILSDGVKANLVQLELYLPAAGAMIREVSLPPADARHRREMLRFQLPRLTPFTTDKIYFDVACVDDAESVVLMAALPRSCADPLIAALERVTALRVSRLAIDDERLPKTLNLFGEPRVPSRWWRRINTNGALLLLLVAIMTLAMAMPLYARHEYMVERKRQMARVQTAVADSLATREMLQDSLSTLGAILEQRRSAPPTAVLAELSRVVPETVFLTEIRLQGQEVHFSGRGAGVVALIDLLNNSAMFEEARFTSSVTRNPRTGEDQFTVSMRLASHGEDS